MAGLSLVAMGWCIVTLHVVVSMVACGSTICAHVLGNAALEYRMTFFLFLLRRLSYPWRAWRDNTPIKPHRQEKHVMLLTKRLKQLVQLEVSDPA